MQTIFLNDRELNKVQKMKTSYTKRCKRKFNQKLYNHINRENIRDFYNSLNVSYSDKLYEVKFKKSFSLYLYLFLKSRAEPYEILTSKEFTVSKPLEVNFSTISLKAQVGRNTVKRAFRELISLGLLIFDDNLKKTLKNYNVKKCMVVNDYYLEGYDEDNNKIIYSIKSKEKNQ